ncbi:MAG TPA: SagB/ThcOx family dehydrogenase [Candidatus Binatia bacterium]|nr:SagB/ThcOx family dehydrogenase [Candidatus Binatia bacterium]
MKNRELTAAWDYHNGSKHSYQSIRSSRHYLDWENQPIPFKIYPDLVPIPLPQHLSSSGIAALDAISMPEAAALPEVVPSIQTLAEMLFLSAGITKRRSHPGGEMLFRAAACTGALYHIDLYLICGELADLEAGIYHFSPQDFALRRLRSGDYRSLLVEASGREPAITHAPVIVVCASTFWRNAWKYQARAYRHAYWDNGTILANLLAAAAVRAVPAKVIVGFIDSAVNRLLGLDSQREAAVSLVALGTAPSAVTQSVPTVAPLALETVPLSKNEIDYPAIRAMHEASSLESEEEILAWRENAKQEIEEPKHENGKEGRLFALRSMSAQEISSDKFEEVVLRRGSTRAFSRESISFAQLSTMLDRATRGLAADFLNSEGESLNDLYLIVHAVDDLPSGAYVYRRDKHALELLKEGNFRREAGYLGLGQEIPADCSVNVYFMADLDCSLERFGNRGYRAAQLEAAIMGGKLYLAAYAQKLGASGLTFFDDDVTDFFSPHAADKSVMFLIALGQSAKRKGLR